MDDRTFTRIGSISAGAVGALSLLYAIAYLGITPADQRGSDIDKFFRSYLAHPTGLRLASLCLFLSGLVSGIAVIALIGRITRGLADNRALTWAGIVAVIAGLATSAHGLGDLVGVDKLAHRYAAGDAATKAAVAVAHVTPSAVDPRGLASFAASGLVALAIGLALRQSHPRLGKLGVVLGADMALLFVANALGINALVLLTGGLASVVLGPIWWFALARLLWDPDAAARVPTTVSSTAGI
jgi:amino acid transporter